MVEVVSEPVQESVEESIEKVVEEVVEPKAKLSAAELEELETLKKIKKKPLEVHHEYVSKLEEIIDTKPVEDKSKAKKTYKKKSEEEERRLRASELVTDKEYEIKIEYTDEELEEIERQQMLDNDAWEEEIDYEDYEDFYDDEE